MAALPQGWEERVSKSSGRNYFYNTYTKSTQWDTPDSVPPGQVSTVITTEFC